MNLPLNVKAFYPNFFSDRLISYVCLSLVENLRENDKINATAMGLSSDSTVDRYRRTQTGPKGACNGIYCDAIPRGILWAAASRILQGERMLRVAEWRYLRGLRRGDVAYLWPGASLDLHRKAKTRGCVVITERINTLRFNSREILEKEFDSLGIPAAHGISEDSARDELRCMELSDYIFSPSPAVTESLTKAGIPGDAILHTSYGLRRSEILDRSRDRPFDRPITALFVGRICVRKGVHLLLKAWTQARVNGRLKVVGTIAPEIRDLFDSHLRMNDTIEHVDYVEDLRPIYEQADFFILPSLEEGSPLVTYLALGASLPVIVSPMGAGGVITDSKEGFVVDPKNGEQLVKTIQKLTNSSSLRNEMSKASAKTAMDYTWEKVAERRRRQLLEKLAR
jgi:glycosyltransferase involved in cell wall biosynthesis